MERNLLLSEISSDKLAEKVAAIVIDKLSTIIPVPEKKIQYVSRKQVAELLHVSLPTVDAYTEEKLLIKYGHGKRGKYILEEVEASRSLIYSNMYKKRKY